MRKLSIDEEERRLRKEILEEEAIESFMEPDIFYRGAWEDGFEYDKDTGKKIDDVKFEDCLKLAMEKGRVVFD